MPMPSLLRYFAVVGSALLGLLLFVNYLFDAPAAPEAPAAAKVAVRHDPRASLIERWRDEQAAMKAAERHEPVIPAVVPVAAAPQPPVPIAEPSPTRPEPPQISTPAALHTAATEPQADTAKAEKLKAAKIRRARVARERARARQQEEAAARQQDQFFYGSARPTYAYAPPFGFGR